MPQPGRTYKALGDTHVSLAKATKQTASWQEARSWYKRGLGILEPFAAQGAQDAEVRTLLAEMNTALAACNTALEKTQDR